jgi:signal transduction histidine kinase
MSAAGPASDGVGVRADPRAGKPPAAEVALANERARHGDEPPSPYHTAALRELCHDVRQPAAAICALVAALEVMRDIPFAARPRLAQIAGEARRISDLCRETLALRTAPVAVRVDTVAEQAAGTMRETFAGRIDVSASPATVVMDELLLWRVVINLLENACRAAEVGGHVAVRVRQNASTVSIQVSDSGPGFGLASSGTSSLGLMIAERALRGSGGLLTVDRGPLSGARVTVRLPRADSSPEHSAVESW